MTLVSSLTNQVCDGFGTAQSGLSGLKRLLVESFILSRENTEKDPTEFGQQAVAMTQKTVESTGTFAWITSASNSRIDQINVGRENCGINLKASAIVLAKHPISEMLQEYKDMLPLQATFKNFFNIKASDTVQMLFRLGTAEMRPHSPRRAEADIIRAEYLDVLFIDIVFQTYSSRLKVKGSTIHEKVSNVPPSSIGFKKRELLFLAL